LAKKDTVQCPKCNKISELNSLKPVFKKEFSKADGTLDIPLDVLFAGGWLGKTLEGMACPKCGEILAVTSPSSSSFNRRNEKKGTEAYVVTKQVGGSVT
jgi:ssDNA-binding Zn-finger/Zn-ribbon topoisomerase 1